MFRQRPTRISALPSCIRCASSARRPIILHRPGNFKAASSPTQSYLSATLHPIPKDTHTNRKLLVLDLNGTLVFRSRPVDNRKRMVHPRPYLATFRSFLLHPVTRGWLDTMVWSSAQSHNVVDMVDSSFGASRGDLLAIWARDKMDLDVRSYHKKVSTIKNLEKVWSEISSPERHSLYTTLLLDDSPAKAILQPYNHLIVEEYNEDLHAHNASLRSENPYPDNTATSGKDTSHSPAKYDDTLLAVVGILDAMKDKPNVARWIRRGGLCLQDRISDAESGEQPWFRIPDVRKHWKTRGAVALDDLGVNLDPGVPS